MPLEKFLLCALTLATPVFAADGIPIGQEEIFVVDENGSIAVFRRTANGDVPPLRTIVGAATGLVAPQKLDFDPVHSQLAVCTGADQSILVFRSTDSANAAPIRTIAGPTNTLLGETDAVAIDTVHNQMLVASNYHNPDSAHAIYTYSRTATGDVAPVRGLTGPTTLIEDPAGLTLDHVHDEIFVANGFNTDAKEKILVFARTASGDQAPLREIAGASTQLAGPEGMAVDEQHNELFVANNFGGVTVYSRTANGNVSPIRQISGANTGLGAAEDVALDLAHDELFVVDDSGKILVFGRTDNGNVLPKREISGGLTGLSNPQGIRLLPWLFADGFELGDVTGWSSSVG